MPVFKIKDRRDSGRVIFKGRFVSIKECVEEAISKGVSLSNADLSDMDLSGLRAFGADLRWADLSGAKLRNAMFRNATMMAADFRGADLLCAMFREVNLNGAMLIGANCIHTNFVKTNLLYANLSHAILAFADLNGVDLCGAALRGVVGNGRHIVTIPTDRWPVVYTATHMEIGCRRYRLDEWWKFDDSKISAMDECALEFWKKWKPILQQIVEANPARPTGYVRHNVEAPEAA